MGTTRGPARRIWERLVDPPADAVEVDERRHARLLSAVLVTIIALGSLSQATCRNIF